ncbi:MAG TPA: alpha/beta fold hydrolase [Acidimicrobiales bacterium]|nr:alpha/beta fold hydrolase [Acidimicrobiales bacterium]
MLASEIVGEGDRLVLVHGFTQTGASWRPVTPYLRRHYELVVADAPGHGGSATLETDLVEGARHLVETGGRARYLGYSMGGRLCLRAALDHPEVVEQLVLVSATAGLQDASERDVRRKSDEALACQLEDGGVDAFLQQWIDNPLFDTLPDKAARVEERRTNTVAGLASSLRLAGAGAQEPVWSRLGELTMPVLLVTGELDAKFTELATRMRAAIGPNAEHVTIAGAGHALHLERPGVFAETVLGFLDGSLTRTAPPRTGRRSTDAVSPWPEGTR